MINDHSTFFDSIEDFLGFSDTNKLSQDHLLDYMHSSGIDLSQYSIDEIKDALDSFLDTDKVQHFSFHSEDSDNCDSSSDTDGSCSFDANDSNYEAASDVPESPYISGDVPASLEYPSSTRVGHLKNPNGSVTGIYRD
jgi:hypothetical protein